MLPILFGVLIALASLVWVLAPLWRAMRRPAPPDDDVADRESEVASP